MSASANASPTPDIHTRMTLVEERSAELRRVLEKQSQTLDSTHDAVMAIQTRLVDLVERLADAEHREHLCLKVDTLNDLNTEIKTIHGNRSALGRAMIGSIIGLFVMAGGWVWWASALETNLQHEVERRTLEDGLLKSSVEQRPTIIEIAARTKSVEHWDRIEATLDDLQRQCYRTPTQDTWVEQLPPDTRRAVCAGVIAHPAGVSPEILRQCH